MINFKRLRSLLKDYEYGLGFRKGDILIPKKNAKPFTHDVIDNAVVVLRQDALCYHQYLVVGECKSPKTPAERFVRFEINGHDWERV